MISSPKQSPEFSMEYNSTNKGTVKSSWNSHNGTAGGGIHERSWRNSPLFRVSMSTFVQCKGYLRITISLPDERQDAAKIGLFNFVNWDGNQRSGGEILYPAHAIYLCKDDPCLDEIIANTDFLSQRDVSLEIFIDTNDYGPFSFVAVPCTFDVNFDSAFYVDSTFCTLDGENVDIDIEAISRWSGYDYGAKIDGNWIQGHNSFGPISNQNIHSSLNPIYRLKMDTNHYAAELKDQNNEEKKRDRQNNNLIPKHLQICSILTPNISQDSLSYSLKEHETIKTGTYLISPYALSNLVHHHGKCGLQQINDGFIGSFRFKETPTTIRKESLTIFSCNDPTKMENKKYARGTDIFDEIYILPTLVNTKVSGSYSLEVMANLPFSLETVNPAVEIPAPIRKKDVNIFGISIKDLKHQESINIPNHGNNDNNHIEYEEQINSRGNDKDEGPQTTNGNIKMEIDHSHRVQEMIKEFPQTMKEEITEQMPNRLLKLLSKMY